MELFLLLIVFLVIVITLFVFKKLLSIAVGLGIFSAIILFQIPIDKAINLILKATTSSNTINVLLILYTVTLLQRMMQHEGALKEAQLSLEKIFNNRRINTFVAPTFMGLLPSASAIYMAGEMVDTSAKDELSAKDKTFVASYFRHVFESFLPTYSSVIILVSLAGIDITSFVVVMLPMVGIYIGLGYLFYLRKLDHFHTKTEYDKTRELISALKAISPVLIILFLIMILKVEVQYATIFVIIGYSIVKRYKANDIIKYIKNAFEIRVLLTTLTIFIFKDIILSTNVMEQLPTLFEQLGLPLFIVYGIIFFVSSLLLGNTATYVIFVPLTLVAIPNGGVSLYVYLNCVAFMAMQIAPTHICLFLACEYFKTDMTSLVKRTIPIAIIFVICATLYYILLLKVV